jgi:hypothetical protein
MRRGEFTWGKVGWKFGGLEKEVSGFELMVSWLVYCLGLADPQDF